ncbi:MAG: hypothetical protein IJD99_07565 [Clostridia bacterium]|nr:hypothetical protein [Clostridia bacterium]
MKKLFSIFLILLMMLTSAFAMEEKDSHLLTGTLADMEIALEDLTALLPSPIDVKRDNNTLTFADKNYSNIDVQPPFVEGVLDQGVWTIEIPEGADLSETRIEAWPKGGSYYAYSLDGAVTNIRVQTDALIIIYDNGEWKISSTSKEANYDLAAFDAQGQLKEYQYVFAFPLEGKNLRTEISYLATGELQWIRMYSGFMPVYEYDVWCGEGTWYDVDWNECDGPGELAGLSLEEITAKYPPLFVAPPAEQE